MHVCAFVGILVTLWVLAPRGDYRSVFTTFTNGGWDSVGGSALVGITSGILPLLGADAAVHMSEELRDAGKMLPRTMIWSTVFNGALGWVMIITFCFCIGNVDQVLASPTGYPYMQVYYNATQSTRGATAMIVFVTFMSIFSNLTMVATTSRQLYAFARDQAVPFSPWLSRVTWNLPVNSIVVTFFTSVLLSLINTGSAAALNSITSLATSSLLSSYICCIGCITWRRLMKRPLPASKFSLGRYGLAINIVSEIFLIIIFILAFFPAVPRPSAVDMNWSILIYGATVAFSLVYHLFYGRHKYVGPVEYVRKIT